MFPQKRQINAEVDPKTYPLGEQIEPLTDVTGVTEGPALALVALDHTPVERRLYTAMIRALEPSNNQLADSNQPSCFTSDVFTVRRVMQLTDIGNLSTVRRGLEGLVAKSSAERVPKSSDSADSNGDGSAANVNGHNGNGRDHGVCYRVRMPDEVIARRDETGTNTFRNGISTARNRGFERVIHRIVATRSLSRREAQVALCCAEGLTNAEIGLRLKVKEQTVKFHLRHVFLKFGVKRRAELISRLLL